MDQLMSPAQLAEYLAVPVTSLYQWRVHGVGPRGIRVGRHVRYRRSDVEAWLNAQAEQTVMVQPGSVA